MHDGRKRNALEDPHELQYAAVSPTLIDSSTSATFNINSSSACFGATAGLSAVDPDGTIGPSLVAAGACDQSFWKLELVTPDTTTKPITISSSDLEAGAAVASVSAPSAKELLFVWNVTSPYALDVTVSVELVAGQINFVPTFHVKEHNVALWYWALSPIGSVPLDKQSAVFQNAGFGVVHQPPSSFCGIYPQQTMQFASVLLNQPSDAINQGQQPPMAVYFGAHDPRAESKGFCTAVSGDSASFQVGATPPGAGIPAPIIPYTVAYPVVVAPLRGSWWDAAQMYRQWVLPNAKWTQGGPMATRSPSIAPWIFNLTTWVNSHWQQHDIFNRTDGDPTVVANRVSAIASRFGIATDALALHWYEWDTLGYDLGSNYSKCNSEITCGFDTHYPEYFPVRSGFNESLSRMQNLGVRVAPYINGRIFDQATKTWTAANASDAAAKSAAPTLGSSNLSLYNEQYGSEAKFAVMCPATSYWQGTIGDVVSTLCKPNELDALAAPFSSFGTDGVYIDQIAAAGPRPCFDPSHGHAIGGGSHWVDGYLEMLKGIREKVGYDKMLLTESNAEPFMRDLNMYLTLVGFAAGNLPPVPADSGSVIVPAFQSVYGGYVLFVGAEFFQEDFVNPDVFAAKIANQYVFGAQMGWFSLGGTQYPPPMGIFDHLMDSQYDCEVEYLSKLSAAKQTGADFFNFGRAMRPVDVAVNGTTSASACSQSGETYRRTAVISTSLAPVTRLGSTFEYEAASPEAVPSYNLSTVLFGAVMSSAWLDADGKALLVTVTTVPRDTPAHIQVVLDMTQYGFPEAVKNTFDVFSVEVGTGNKTLLNHFEGKDVNFSQSMEARSVSLFIIEIAR
eukprot:INCI13567.1.p1 GENE.INCI13567.1~~INCI13567.1.p1  ORF type:complete len:906 (-),score=144.86 INCI13567.1:122-2659(-)